jgi:hypothetical protein
LTLLENLQAHRGGLLRLKTEIFWYGNRGWDRNPGRVCLILDAASADTATPAAAAHAAAFPDDEASTGAAALLLVDGSPQWIWLAEVDVEVLDEAR